MRSTRDLRLSFTSMVLFLVFILIAVVALLAPTESDTFWQLRAGQEILRSGQIPLTDTYSHTATGLPWPNHSWIWQASAFLLLTVGGLPLLSLANGALAAGALGLSFSLARGEPVRSTLLLMLSIPLAASTWAIRPQATSQLLFVVLLWLLTRQRFIWIPPLFLLWANLHAAVSVGGLVLVVSLGFAAATWWRSPIPAAVARVRTLAAVTGLSGLATLVTPLGIGLWSYIPTSILKSRSNAIAEWSSALQWSADDVGIWVWVFWVWTAGFAILAVRRGRRLRGWNDQLLLVVGAATMLLAFSAVRNTAWFVLASLPALRALTRPIRPTRKPIDDDRSVAHSIAVGVVAAAGAVALGVAWSAPAKILNWHPTPPAIASAVERCPGPLYNTYNNGGYLIWAVPAVPVFIDSRQDPYPQEFLTKHIETEASGNYRVVFAEYGIECAALPPDSPTTKALIRDRWVEAAREPGWVVLYQPEAG